MKAMTWKQLYEHLKNHGLRNNSVIIDFIPVVESVYPEPTILNIQLRILLKPGASIILREVYKDVLSKKKPEKSNQFSKIKKIIF